MLTLLFIFCFVAFIGKVAGLALKASWGITKFVVEVILFPIALMIMAIAGLAYIAIPILIIARILAEIISPMPS